jgi:two-component system, NarL family, nitrate/nitrite response regulator NarL
LPTILLVDDEPAFRLLTRLILEEHPDLKVAGEAADGKEAIREAKRLRPELILLDLHMPVLGGLEALPQLRAAAPAARIVVLSVAYDQANLFKAKMAGAHAFIDKGLDNEAFLRALRDCLNSGPGWSAHHRLDGPH